jgi:hypothetical protein
LEGRDGFRKFRHKGKGDGLQPMAGVNRVREYSCLR